MGVYLQQKDKLLRLSGENITDEKVINALGYVPADENVVKNHIKDKDVHVSAEDRENWDNKDYASLENKPNIEDDGSGSFNVTDDDGHIIFKADAAGIHSTDLFLNKNSKGINEIITSNEENIVKTNEKINNLNQSVVNHINDFDEHIINEFIPVDERTKNLDGNQLTNLLSVVDNDGHIIATIDKDGFHTTNLFVKSSSYAGEENINSKIKEHIEAFEEYKKTAAEQITTDKLNVNEIESTSIVTDDLSANQVNINNLNVAEDIILNGEFKNNNSVFNITDSNGYIVTQVDSRGLNTIALLLNGENVLDIINNRIADLVDSSPETLNTLNELAAALGDDPNFATTISTQIGNLESKKLDKTTFDDHVNGVFTTLSKDFEEHQQEFSDYQTAVDNRFTNLINNAPEDLNTLGELATAITDHVEDFEEYKENLSELVDTTKLKSNEIETVFIESDYIVTNRVNIANNLNVTGDISLNGDLKHNDSVFNITDPNGNIIMQVDKDGLNTIALMLDGEDVLDIVDDKIAVVVDNSPETLNTLRKIATALNNDAQFATTVSNDFKAVNDKIDTHIEDAFNPFKEAYDTHIEDEFGPLKQAFDNHVDKYNTEIPILQEKTEYIEITDDKGFIITDGTENSNIFLKVDENGLETTNINTKTLFLNEQNIVENFESKNINSSESITGNQLTVENATIKNDLTVQGAIVLDGDITTEGNIGAAGLTTSGDITSSGKVRGNNLSSDTNISLNGTITGATDITASGKLSVKDIEVSGDLSVNDIIVSGNISTESGTISSKDINASNNIFATGSISTNSILNAKGQIVGEAGLNITGDATISNNISAVSGNINDLTVNNILVNGELQNNDDVFNITDKDGNIITSVDANGLHTTNLYVKPTQESTEENILDIIDDKDTAVNTALTTKINDTNTTLTNKINEVNNTLTGSIGDLNTILTKKIEDADKILSESIDEVSKNLSDYQTNISNEIVSKKATINGNITATGTITASGDISGKNLILSEDMTGANITLTGDAAANNINVTTKITTKDLQATNNVTVTETVSAKKITATEVEISGDTSITGAIDSDSIITKNLIVQKEEGNSITGNATIQNQLTIDGNEILKGNLTATTENYGIIEANKFISNGDIEATGNVSMNSLSTASDSSIGNNLTVNNDIIIKGSLQNSDKVFNIVDNNGNIVAKIDAEGLNTIALKLKDVDILKIIDTEIANVIDAAPETLNTLNELAAALGDDPNFATTVSNRIGTIEDNKLDKTTFNTHVNGPFATLEKNFNDYKDVLATEIVSNKATINGNISGIDINSTGNITATTSGKGTITGNEMVSRGNVSATGTVFGENASFTGSVTAGGDIKGKTIEATNGNIVASGTVKGAKVESTGDISIGGDATVTGNVSTTNGTISAKNINASESVLTKDLTATGTISTNSTLTANGKITGKAGLDITGDGSVSNILTVKDLSVTNNVSVSKDLTVGENVIINGKLQNNDDVFNITDSEENVIATVDKNGINTVDLLINGDSYINKINNHIKDFDDYKKSLAESITTKKATITEELNVGSENVIVTLKDGNVAATNKINAGSLYIEGTSELKGNIATEGNLTATGEISSKNLKAVKKDGAGGDIVADGDISTSTGTVSGATLNSGGDITAESGIVKAKSITTNSTNPEEDGNIEAKNAVKGATIESTGNISANGTVSGANLVANTGTLSVGSTSTLTGAVTAKDNLIVEGDITATATNKGTVTVNKLDSKGDVVAAGTVSSANAFFGAISGTSLSVSGDIESTAGNVKGLNIEATNGNITATGNIETTAGTISGAVLNSTGAVTAAGAISTTNGNISTDKGNITTTDGYISANSSITGGSIVSNGDIFANNIITNKYTEGETVINTTIGKGISTDGNITSVNLITGEVIANNVYANNGTIKGKTIIAGTTDSDGNVEAGSGEVKAGTVHSAGNISAKGTISNDYTRNSDGVVVNTVIANGISVKNGNISVLETDTSTGVTSTHSTLYPNGQITLSGQLRADGDVYANYSTNGGRVSLLATNTLAQQNKASLANVVTKAMFSLSGTTLTITIK